MSITYLAYRESHWQEVYFPANLDHFMKSTEESADCVKNTITRGKTCKF